MERQGINLLAAPSGTGCAECLANGGWWLHLRRCAECGHIGCCDTSPNQHASKHNATTGHPVITSFEPGEEWYYDYGSREFFAGPSLAPSALTSGKPTGTRTSWARALKLANTSPLARQVLMRRSDLTPPLAWIGRLFIWSYLFDRHDADLPRIALTSLVTKIKNVGRKAKPFHTILETPDTAGFRQKINRPRTRPSIARSYSTVCLAWASGCNLRQFIKSVL